MSASPVFSLTGPLPHGRVAIEASAGTGKTFALAGLVARYVAEEDLSIDKLLMVTFTRAAAAELRDRVRTRLTEAVTALRAGTDLSDELLALVAATDRERRLERLERAVSEFDAATITTIHGFAQQVLSTLGSQAPGNLDVTLLEDTAELVNTVCADVLAAASVADPGSSEELPGRDALAKLATEVLGNPGIHVVPDGLDGASVPAAARIRVLLDSVVEQVHERRRAAGTVAFDDLLTQLRDALVRSPGAIATLRRRFQIALIDEFQDTDPVQWEIFSTLFGTGHDDSSLVLVADPKQAIYAFRGANVHTYLEAAYSQGTARATLGTNWRSDGALLAALERVLKGATFGDPRIGFVAVAPSEGNSDVRLGPLEGVPLPALAVRLAVGEDLPRIGGGQVGMAAAVGAVARDLADQVHELLETAWLPARDGSDAKRRLRPSDVAVLICKNAEAEPMRQALRQRGIPAVTTRSDNVVASAAATQWRWLLTSLDRPTDPRRARTAALSWFFGWSAAELDEEGDARLGQVQDSLMSWADTLGDHGTGELCARIFAESGVTARVLASSEGDRNLTDLDHIAGLLKASVAGRRPTVMSLLATLDELEARLPGDPEDDPTARRIESEAEAVQIMTVHVAKGLEFPVVCVPTLWRNGGGNHEVVYEDPDERPAHHRHRQWSGMAGRGRVQGSQASRRGGGRRREPPPCLCGAHPCRAHDAPVVEPGAVE